MKTLHWITLGLYLSVAAGFGGWRGQDLFTGWTAALLLLPPFAWFLFMSIRDARRIGLPLSASLPMVAFGTLLLGGIALLLAWCVGEATGRWSASPEVRAAIGGVMAALAMMLTAIRSRAKAPPAGGESEP